MGNQPEIGRRAQRQHRAQCLAQNCSFLQAQEQLLSAGREQAAKEEKARGEIGQLSPTSAWTLHATAALRPSYGPNWLQRLHYYGGIQLSSHLWSQIHH